MKRRIDVKLSVFSSNICKYSARKNMYLMKKTVENPRHYNCIKMRLFFIPHFLLV